MSLQKGEKNIDTYLLLTHNLGILLSPPAAVNVVKLIWRIFSVFELSRIFLY